MHLPEPDDRLSSWKEIAAYLGRNVRTVQRWEKNDGLPLRRGGPGQRGAVIASRREINEWWERRKSTLGEPEPPEAGALPASRERFGWVALTVVTAAMVITAAILLLLMRRTSATADEPPRLGRLLAASTSEGRSYSFTPLGAAPASLVVSPSGDVAYVALPRQHAVATVDLHRRAVIDRINVIDSPSVLALSSSGRHLFIGGSSEVGELDLERRTMRRFPVRGTVRDLHVSRDGSHLWIALAQAGLKVLNLDSGQTEVVPTIGCPMYLAAAPRSRRVFVSYQCGGPGGRDGHDAVEVIDELTRQSIIARAGPPLVGSVLTVSPDEQHVWIDTADACANDEYDLVGCPPGKGPVLHALRTDTLEPLLTIRITAEESGANPVFLPDGSRLVTIAGPRLKIIDRSLGVEFESTDRTMGAGKFTADGRRFITIDPVSAGILELTVTPPQDSPALQGMRTHWSGDGTVNDVMGGNHAVRADGVHFEPGRYGQAFSFDGRSEGLNFGRRQDADITAGPATYAAWIKPRSTGATMYMSSRTSSQGWRWFLTAEGRVALCFEKGPPELSCAGGGLQAATRLLPDTWYHVAVVRDARGVTAFVDGRADGTLALAGDFEAPSAPWNEPILRLGAGPDGVSRFHGLIDEVTLFSRALSAAEVSELRRATWLDAR